MGGYHYWGTCGCTFATVPDGPGLVCAEPSGHKGAHHAHGVTWTDPFRPATDPQPGAGPPEEDRLIAINALRLMVAGDYWGSTAESIAAWKAGAEALEEVDRLQRERRALLGTIEYWEREIARLDEVSRAARAFLGAFDHAESHAEVIETAAALESVLAKEES